MALRTNYQFLFLPIRTNNTRFKIFYNFGRTRIKYTHKIRRWKPKWKRFPTTLGMKWGTNALTFDYKPFISLLWRSRLGEFQLAVRYGRCSKIPKPPLELLNESFKDKVIQMLVMVTVKKERSIWNKNRE